MTWESETRQTKEAKIQVWSRLDFGARRVLFAIKHLSVALCRNLPILSIKRLNLHLLAHVELSVEIKQKLVHEPVQQRLHVMARRLHFHAHLGVHLNLLQLRNVAKHGDHNLLERLLQSGRPTVKLYVRSVIQILVTNSVHRLLKRR